ncbi:MAG: bifunctional 4-hydroxy-2-oxoglutarate aldolase/2-dehydro-3-deoxy-phosphogluconate aldolase [Candidatus Omnitrophica bacterium]|nr:bifunctional 4-hydroxy-2-oxoglutarate aldolase/2-dehydro-3-deoxy-phosphogluconate aldolase [Candidatus Omnitrophota bacterium]
MNLKSFKKLPVMGILRGIKKDAVSGLVETMTGSGLRTVEIAMNTKAAPELIKAMRKKAGSQLTVGAGTVLTLESLKKALDAGASFIVLPVLADEVVAACRKRKIPVFPGAFTPQEIYRAWQAGATMVKVFPAKFFGPAYFKEIKGPFNDIELLACGGITPETVREFLSSGASAVAFGASIFKKEWLKARDYTRIGECIKNLLKASA